jgi:hypothetical protein
MFGVLNLLLILIIVSVVIIHITLTHTRISNLESKLSSRNVLDLAEFNKLDKEFKRNYQKYIVNGVMPHYMDVANKVIKDNDINKIVADNKGEIAKSIDSLPYNLATKSSTKTATPTPTKSTTTVSAAEPSTSVKEKFQSYNVW